MTSDAATADSMARLQGSFPRALIETLQSNGADTSALMGLLSRTSLTEEQQAIIEMLMSLDEPDDATESPAVTDGRSRAKSRVMQQELDDLREANDTLARALGACPYCWGGDNDCPECDGRGSAGNDSPDLELYHELIAPAVRRVRAMERAGVALTKRSHPRNGGRT